MSASKYGEIIRKARESDDRSTDEPDSQPSSKPDKEREVNLCTRVPESHRRHWSAEAKRQGTTMKQVMVAALVDRFGLPDGE